FCFSLSRAPRALHSFLHDALPIYLEAPAKLLVPRLTPLRNSISRIKGQGTARKFKRILGWSNSGVGGVADQTPLMNSTTASTSLDRKSTRLNSSHVKISYAVFCFQ